MTFPSVAYWQPTLAVSHSALLPYVPVPPKTRHPQQALHIHGLPDNHPHTVYHNIFPPNHPHRLSQMPPHRTDVPSSLSLLRNGPHGREVITLQEMVPSPQGPTDKREHGNISKH